MVKHEGACTQSAYCVLCKIEGPTATMYRCHTKRLEQAKANKEQTKTVKINPSVYRDGFRTQGKKGLPRTVTKSDLIHLL